MCFRRIRWVCLNPGRLLYNIIWVLISLVTLFLMSRALRLLAPAILEEFVTQIKTQVESIGSAMLIICPILADDTSISHKVPQQLGLYSTLAKLCSRCT
jgi:hypothetical protein